MSEVGWYITYQIANTIVDVAGPYHYKDRAFHELEIQNKQYKQQLYSLQIKYFDGFKWLDK